MITHYNGNEIILDTTFTLKPQKEIKFGKCDRYD